jgi:hypothetical protein
MPRSAIRPLPGLMLMLSLLGSEVAQAAPERVEVVVGAEFGKVRSAERLVQGDAPAVGTGENGWTGRRWSGQTWSGRRWSGRRWSGSDWSGDGGS